MYVNMRYVCLFVFDVYIFTVGYDVLLGIYLDEDECLTSPCDANADCTNTIGSYSCQCQTGYTGSGLMCSGTVIFTLNVAKLVQLKQNRN